MEINEFKRIMKRMESGLRQEVTDLQFEEYLNSFGGEDASIFERAIQRVIDTQRWIPVPAQLKEFIKQIRDEDQGKVNRRLAEKKEAETAKRKPIGDGGWIRFTRWLLETRTKCPVDMDDRRALKAKFEKEHPNWQPSKRRQVKRGGMSRIGGSMGDVIGNLKKEA